MRRQLYYEWRGRGLTRIIALGVFLAVTLFLFATAMANRQSTGVSVASILGATFSGVGFVALLVVATVLAIDSGSRLFTKPRAYFTMIAPVRGWKVLASRVIVILCDYAAVFIAGVGMILLNSYTFLPSGAAMDISVNAPTVYQTRVVIGIVAGLFQIILLYFFARTMTHTVYAGLPAGKLLGVLTFFAGAWLWSSLDILLMPFGHLHSFGPFYSVELSYHSLAATVAYAVFSVIKMAGVFLATAYLLETKMNL